MIEQHEINRDARAAAAIHGHPEIHPTNKVALPLHDRHDPVEVVIQDDLVVHGQIKAVAVEKFRRIRRVR